VRLAKSFCQDVEFSPEDARQKSNGWVNLEEVSDSPKVALWQTLHF
jgi:hypothetical protein